MQDGTCSGFNDLVECDRMKQIITLFGQIKRLLRYNCFSQIININKHFRQ